jgi:hypothetical protein
MLLNYRIFYSRILLLTFYLTLFIECRGPRSLINDTAYDLDCPQVINYGPSNTEPIENIQFDALLTDKYSHNSLVMANAYGLIDDLTALEKLKISKNSYGSSDSMRIAILEEEKEIDKILDMAFLELESYESFIECNILNLVRLNNLLTESNNKMRSNYTNAAIIVGLASAALVGGIILSSNDDLQEGDAVEWIGIGGAVVAAALAVYSERIDKRVDLKLNKNLIKPIWTGKHDGEVFSDRYWYLLNQDLFPDSVDISVREFILNTWEGSDGLLGSDKNRSYLPILLADEAAYTEEQLMLRIDLLEELKIGIDHFSRSLYVLNFEID